MKKISKLFLMLPLMMGIVALSTLTSCNDQKVDVTLESVTVVQSTVPAEIVQGTIDTELSKIQLKVTMSDGSEKLVNVTKDMISAKDLEKLTEIGTYNVKISYEGKEVQVKLTIIEANTTVTLTDITLAVENANVEVEYGASHSALTGVSAVGNDNISYAQKLTYVITNKAGETVDKVDTYKENEVYTVVISIDYNGIKKSVTKTVTVGEKPDTSGNLIPDGTFAMADGKYTGWATYEDQSSVTYGCEEIGGTMFAKVVEETVSSFAYSPRLNNTSGNYFQLFAGQAYKISFQAKASAAKTIQCQVGQLVGGAPYFYDFAGLMSEHKITTDMATYSFTFIATNSAGGDMSCSSVTFELGTVNGDSTAATIWIGNVVVEEFSGKVEDTLAPVITANNKTVYIGAQEVVDLNELISVNDAVDGQITPTIVIKNEAGEVVEFINGTVAGVYTVEISAVDAAANEATATITVTVKEKPGSQTIKFEAEDQTLGFIEEATMTAGQIGYWNDQNWCGSQVTVTQANIVNNEIVLEYTSTGACDWGFQLFHKNENLDAGETYKLALVINVLNPMSANINGTLHQLVAGDNTIELEYVEGDISSIDIQFVIAADATGNTIKLSNVQWKVEGSSDVKFAVANQELGFIEEASMTAGQIGYWNDQNWCGSQVTVTSAKVVDNAIELVYTSTGTCTFGYQLFYKNENLNAGEAYVLSFVINVLNPITAGINGKTFDLVAGDNQVEVAYVEAGDVSSIDIQFGIVDGVSGNTLKLSNIVWKLDEGTNEGEGNEGSTDAVQSETFNLEDATLAFSGEGDVQAGQLAYWNDQNWCGSNVTVTSANVTNNEINFVISSTGACDFGFQVFYKSATLTANQTYTLTLVINVTNAQTIKVNDVTFELVAGDNAISVDYVEGGQVSSLDIQFVVNDVFNANTIKMSNISWTLKTEESSGNEGDSSDTKTINIDATLTKVEGAGIMVYLADKPAITVDDLTITIKSVTTVDHAVHIEQIMAGATKVHYIPETGYFYSTVAVGLPVGGDQVMVVNVSYTLNGVTYSKDLTFSGNLLVTE